jgi:hypothetical protein
MMSAKTKFIVHVIRMHEESIEVYASMRLDAEVEALKLDHVVAVLGVECPGESEIEPRPGT